MKKYIVQPKWKKYLERVSADKLKRKRRKKNRKPKQCQKNKQLVPRRSGKFTNLKAPSIFSLINNSDETLAYFNMAKSTLNKRLQVEFDLSKVNNMTPDAIAYLVASVHHPGFTKGLGVKGNSPIQPDASRMFSESGFLGHVYSERQGISSPKHLLLHKITKSKVENDLAKKSCLLAVNHTFGNSNIFRPIYEILIECMANTKNHASPGSQGKYDWWLFEYNDPNNNITKFTFLDLGVGIFESLPVRNYIRKFLTNIGWKKNADLMPRLLSGEISSRTGLKERGRGFPLIYNHSKNKHIGSFIIISNDVYADVKNEKYSKMKYILPGTLLYFELVPRGVN